MRVRRPASIDQADASWTRRQRTGPKIGRDRLTINITKHDYVEKTSKPKQAEPIGPTHKVAVTLTVTNSYWGGSVDDPLALIVQVIVDKFTSYLSHKQRRRKQVDAYIK